MPHLRQFLVLIILAIGLVLTCAGCTAAPSVPPTPTTVAQAVVTETALPPTPSPPPTDTPRPAPPTATRAPTASVPATTRPTVAPTAVATASPPPTATPAQPTAVAPTIVAQAGSTRPGAAAPAPAARAQGQGDGPPPIASLDDVFPPRDLAALNLDPARLRTIVATGDVIPARSVDTMIRRRNNDFAYPLARTKDLLGDGDLTVINLEAPLIQRCPPHDTGFTFCGQVGFARALKNAGVDLATLENNHIGNYGWQGIEETKQRLDEVGILWADRKTPAVVDLNGLRVGFLAYNGVGERFDRPAMVEAIQALRPQVDVLVVAVHWGREYVAIPAVSPGIANDNPVDIAHLIIDAGADLIIGNHPHWIQAAEVYNGKYIMYAHGNFVFDQMWSDETRLGVVGRYTYYDNRLVSVEYRPVRIDGYAQPVPLQGQAAQTVLNDLEEASRTLAQRLGKP